MATVVLPVAGTPNKTARNGGGGIDLQGTANDPRHPNGSLQQLAPSVQSEARALPACDSRAVALGCSHKLTGSNGMPTPKRWSGSAAEMRISLGPLLQAPPSQMGRDDASQDQLYAAHRQHAHGDHPEIENGSPVRPAALREKGHLPQGNRVRGLHKGFPSGGAKQTLSGNSSRPRRV